MTNENLANAENAKNEENQPKPVKRQRPADVVEVCGVLDVMSDGFGFLRFENLFQKLKNNLCNR